MVSAFMMIPDIPGWYWRNTEAVITSRRNSRIGILITFWTPLGVSSSDFSQLRLHHFFLGRLSDLLDARHPSPKPLSVRGELFFLRLRPPVVSLHYVPFDDGRLFCRHRDGALCAPQK